VNCAAIASNHHYAVIEPLVILLAAWLGWSFIAVKVAYAIFTTMNDNSHPPTRNDMNTQERKAQKFLDLHTSSRLFVMPNAWDAGSARMLASQGFQTIGTTSAGIAFSKGKPDSEGAVSRTEMLDCIRTIAQSVAVPVSADLEAGYGANPAQVGETISLAIDAGIAGANIEDFTGNAGLPLFDVSLAEERIRAARKAANDKGIPFTLTARTDCYLVGVDNPFSESVRRANLYREAGADCLFVPGAVEPKMMAQLVREIDGPISVVMGLKGKALTVSQLEDLGVRRVSIGGSLARATFALIRKAALEIMQQGTFTYANDQIPDAELCAFFSSFKNADSDYLE
jgi:2-methylisocitrate lyase-like PEP mutase family enzyme